MIRSLKLTDLPQILLIEEAVHISPWTESTFKTCLHSSCAGWVIELDRKIIAFLVASLHEDECHILNIGVAREHQRQGFGRELMLHALADLTVRRVTVVYLEVRRSNTRALSLYNQLNFKKIGERKAYYPAPEGAEDALIYAKLL